MPHQAPYICRHTEKNSNTAELKIPLTHTKIVQQGRVGARGHMSTPNDAFVSVGAKSLPVVAVQPAAESMER